jgi:hypothetical protein
MAAVDFSSQSASALSLFSMKSSRSCQPQALRTPKPASPHPAVVIAWCSEEHDDLAYLSRVSLLRARQVHVVADLKLKLYETATGDGLVCHDRVALKPVIIRLRRGAVPAGLRVGRVTEVAW